jgi:uncharacterized protein (TIGR04222 family)
MTSSFVFFLFFLSLIGLGLLVRSKTMAPFESKSHRPLPDEPTYVAWLSGGAKRVAETWWTQLQQAGFLVSPKEGIRPKNKSKDIKIAIAARTDLSQLEPYTRRAAQTLSQYPSRTPVQILDAWKGTIEQVHKEIEQTGWVHYAHEIAGRAAVVRRYLGWALIGGLVGWFTLGWSLWLVGAGMLTALAFAFTTPRPPRLTEHGKRKLQAIQDQYKHAILAPSQTDLAMAVAIGGTVVLMGTPWEAYASPAQRGENHTSSSCSGGCGSMVSSWGGSDGNGCGSSDGGGCGSGCGGGGCS